MPHVFSYSFLHCFSIFFFCVVISLPVLLIFHLFFMFLSISLFLIVYIRVRFFKSPHFYLFYGYFLRHSVVTPQRTIVPTFGHYTTKCLYIIALKLVTACLLFYKFVSSPGLIKWFKYSNTYFICLFII